MLNPANDNSSLFAILKVANQQYLENLANRLGLISADSEITIQRMNKDVRDYRRQNATN